MNVRHMALALFIPLSLCAMKEKEFEVIVQDLTQKTLAILAKREEVEKLKKDSQIVAGNTKAAQDISKLLQEVEGLDKQMNTAISTILKNTSLDEYQKSALECLLKSMPSSEPEDAQLLSQIHETHTII